MGINKLFGILVDGINKQKGVQMNRKTIDLSGKVAIVTGGAAGIGREICLSYAECGAKVVVSDVQDDQGGATVAAIKELGGEAIYARCDVSVPAEVEQLVQVAVKNYGALHIACNNAGIEGQQASISECSLDNWQRVIDINLKGVWLCMKYQIPELIKAGGGSIINMSSIAGLNGFAGLPAYVASKHGVIGLTKTAALEFAKKNIRVNAICPGPIQTQMLQRIMDTSPGFEDSLKAGVPLGRIGSVEEIAQTAAYLSSPGASYITGQALAIDGGWVSQ